MATISLYASKVNNMSGMLRDVKSSVSSLKSEIFQLRVKSLTVDDSICDMDDVISNITAATELQEEKVEALETFARNSETFIATTERIDGDAADRVNQNKDDFYDKYYYLKPECEKSRYEKFKDGCKKIAQWCKDNWKSLVKIVVAVVVIVALGIASVLTCGTLAVILAGAFWGALIGGVLGGLMGGITSMMNGGSFLEGFADGLLSGAITGAVTGAACSALGLAGQAAGTLIKCGSTLGNVVKVTSKVTMVLSTLMDGFDTLAMAVSFFNPDSALVKLNQKLHSSTLYNIAQIGINALAIFTGGAASTMTCFVAGTLILTVSGRVAIENIKAGDKVLATDPNTFDVVEKTVVETYVHENDTLVHLIVDGEEIVTTKNHPFYVRDCGFIEAGELLVGDELLDVQGNILKLEQIEVESLNVPTLVYNFQVEDIHTYHVGEHGIWVHNAECGGRYADLKKTSDSSTEQVHHMPAKSASEKAVGLSQSDGPAIVLSKEDHAKTASFNNKRGSKEYRAKQENLIRQGKFQEAFNMDVTDIKQKFPGKYDDAISDAQKYVDILIKGGKVK